MEDRFEQVSDQPGLLRDRAEEVGPDDAAGRMVPAGERLEPAELPGLQIVLRLIIWGELAKRNAAAKSAFDLVARPQHAFHAAVEPDGAIAAAFLGDVHGDIGAAEQGLDGATVFARNR